MTTAMPRILDCSVTSCSYNKTKSCSAAAITVGYASTCTTFIPLSVKGGLDKPQREAVCGCRTGGPCLCGDCQCGPHCTCH